ncbi:MAG: hypothetical protein IKD45_04690 [Clostridia bacterium]|nr:hypothetical protein [Clostridia bacterium]
MKKLIVSLILSISLIFTLAFALSSCNKGFGKLEAPSNINYDGNVISWSPVEGAEKYYIQVDSLSKVSVNHTAFPLKAPDGQFNVTVTACKGDKEASTTHTFIPLDSVGEIQVADNGDLSWEAVSFASSYILNVDGKETIVYSPEYTALEAGSHSVKVRPHTDSAESGVSYFAKWSSEVSVRILDNVDEDSIAYSNSNGRLVWDSVQYAAGYRIVVTGGSFDIDEVVNSAFYTFDAGTENFTVRITAVGNHSTSFDSKSATERKMVYLEPAQNLRVVDGILYWDEVSGANGYKVKVGGVERSGIVNECQLSGFPVNTSLNVSVLPVSDNTVYFSSWSADFNFSILSAPILQWNNLALDGESNNNIFWDTVNGAHGYEVRVLFNGTEIDSATLGSDMRSYANNYLNVGEYEVRVKALAPLGTTNVSDSEYSAPMKVIRLAAPMFASGSYITSDPANVAAGFTVSFKSVAGATQYRIWKDDAEYAIVSGNLTQYTDSNVVSSSVITAQQFSYKIQSVGSSVRSENAGAQRVVLDSLSATALSFKIDVLPAPTNTTISGFEYSFSEVTGAYGYTVSLNGKANASSSARYNLERLEPGLTEVRVCSRGDGSSVLSSNYTPAISVYRLAAPADIRISTDTGADGQLTFTEIEHCQSYQVIIKGDPTPLPVNNMTNIKEHITTDGTTLHMIAVANYFNELGTTYYMTSPASATKVFTKLEAPEVGEKPFADGWFSWNSPSNIRTGTYTPTYKVYNAQNILQGVTYNGTAMSLSTLPEGTYSFRVVAVGNGSEFINSDLEDAKVIRVTKLRTPTVTVLNNAYTWQTVPNAVNYAVYVDGVLSSTDYNKVGETYTFVPRFTEQKEYTIEVIAIGDGGIEYIDSSPAVVNQKTMQLTAPEFTWSYSSPYYETDGKITATVTKESANATGYYFSFGGATYETDGISSTFTPNSTGEVKITVYARGGAIDDEYYYLDSQSTTQYAYLLNKPGDLDINNYGQMTWSSVTNASKYEVTVIYEGKTYTTVTVSNSSCDLLAILGVIKLPESGSLTVKIRAYGNDSCVASQEYSANWTLG